MTAQLSLPTCVLPGCGTPVGEWGDACDACVALAGSFLRPGGVRLDQAAIKERDAAVAAAYRQQKAAS